MDYCLSWTLVGKEDGEGKSEGEGERGGEGKGEEEEINVILDW